MANLSHCTQCGTTLPPEAKFCTQCGASSNPTLTNKVETPSAKSAVTALLLCIFLGSLGIHRFYVGKIKTGILMLLTGGGLGIWTLIDLIRIACCDFTDSEGKYLIFTKGRASSYKLVIIIFSCIIAVILIYVILLFSLVYFFTSPMTNVIKNQLSALRSKDMNKAYSYMAKETTRTVSLNDFEKYMAFYPAMTNSKNVSIPERRVINHKGFAKVTLEGTDGKETDVDYALIKEDGAWKVLAFRIHDAKTITNQNVSSNKIFSNPIDHYSIQYPSDWNYKQTGKHSVLFSRQNASSPHSTVIIQVVPGQVANRAYPTISAAINELKNQISTKATEVQFANSGEVELPTDTKNVHGEYLVATYTYMGHKMKQMQFLLLRKNENTLYSWTYMSPIEQYEKDLPIAKSMYESWKLDNH